MPTRKARATWTGGLKTGKGRFESSSGAFAAPYSVGTRFGADPGTNPEELLAAAHAACVSMALALGLEKVGHVPEEVQTEAACTVEAEGGGFRITRMELRTRVRAPGIDRATFDLAAAGAKEGCPVSKAFAGNLEITLDAQLE